MKQPVFSGVCTALVTPFISGEVNHPLFDQLLRYQLDNGVNAVVISGTTGESPTLTDQEKIHLFKRAKSFTGRDCTIIAGTGSNSTKHSIALSIAAQEAGADALLVVAPYYNKSNPEGLYLHFTAIARSVDIPVILYNVPSRTGVDIPVSVYKLLSEIPNIAGVKEASSDITKLIRIHNECPDDFYVWSGNDDQIVPIIATGGKGVISVLSNLYPKETVLMTEAALSGDFKTASKMQSDFISLIDLLFCEVNPIPIKYALKHISFDCGPCRLPLGPLSNVNKNRIDSYFT